MRFVAISLALVATAAQAEPPVLVAPSGLGYAQEDPLFEPIGAYEGARRTVRLRFVAPELANPERFGFEVVEPDFQALCDQVGPEIVANSAPNAHQVIISVASEPVVFGESAPSVVQYFDLFRVEGDTCIWEGI